MSYTPYLLQPKVAERAASNLPQTAQVPYFSITGGKVRILTIEGEVTIPIQNNPCQAQWIFNPTAGPDTFLCNGNSIQNDPTGMLYALAGTQTSPMFKGFNGTTEGQQVPIDVSVGTLDFYCNANLTGQTKWTVHWIPLDSAGKLTVL